MWGEVWPLVDNPWASGWLHIQDYTYSTNWTDGLKKKKGRFKVGWGEKEGLDLGEICRGG